MAAAPARGDSVCNILRRINERSVLSSLIPLLPYIPLPFEPLKLKLDNVPLSLRSQRLPTVSITRLGTPNLTPKGPPSSRCSADTPATT